MAEPVADLIGLTVIVAGAGGGGIGTGCCQRALTAGAEVVAVERSPEELDKLDRLARPVTKVEADLTDPEAPATVVQAALDAHGRIDGIINVAGGTSIDDFAPLVDIDRQGWDRVMANNLRYVAFLNREVARAMVDAGTGGAMVNISSVSALASQPFLAAYGAAKAGLNSLTRTMAVEWGSHGIRVNAIAPGTITTPRAGDQESPDATKRAIPLGRRGRPGEIAAAAVFLLSPQASYITGQVLAVDGGMSVKLAMLGDDNAPVFVTDPEVKARMMGSDFSGSLTGQRQAPAVHRMGWRGQGRAGVGGGSNSGGGARRPRRAGDPDDAAQLQAQLRGRELGVPRGQGGRRRLSRRSARRHLRRQPGSGGEGDS